MFCILLQLLLQAIDTFNANVVLVLGQVEAYILNLVSINSPNAILLASSYRIYAIFY